MTIFQFPEKNLEVVKFDKNKIEEIEEITNFHKNKEIKLNTSNIEKSQLTIYLEDTVNFMQNNNLVPDLPEVVKIKYIDNSTLEILINKVKDMFGKKPAFYNYPASTNLATSTIYISNHFITTENNSNLLKNIKRQFDNDSIKTVEYAFFHELGHLFLIEKNKNKIDSSKNLLASVLKENIEEGFAESFAIQMMCIKYTNLQKETENFANFDLETRTRSNKINNYYNSPFLNLDNQPHKLFDVYEFPLIYKNTPFKDKDGNLIIDIETIFKKCLDNALISNKELIKLKMNSIPSSRIKIIKELQLITHNASSNADDLITSFHNKVNDNGFLNKKIQGIRFLITQQNNPHPLKNKLNI
jgi:hypothetical protein